MVLYGEHIEPIIELGVHLFQKSRNFTLGRFTYRALSRPYYRPLYPPINTNFLLSQLTYSCEFSNTETTPTLTISLEKHIYRNQLLLTWNRG